MVVGFDPLSKEEREKKASRAQRFGAISQHTEVKEQTMDEESGMDVGKALFIRQRPEINLT